MSNLDMRHLDEGLLLRYLDGELPRGKANQAREHLEACWQCRAQSEELQVVVGDCVRYRKNVLGACLPPPPAAWKALDFDRADAELAGQSILARLANFLSPRRNAPLRWAISCAAVVVLAAGIFQQLRETPKVEAAALLKRAIAVGQTRPVGGKRLQITTRTGRFVRLINDGAIGAASRSAGANAAAELEVANLFQAAHYDLANPLSAAAFAAWRDQLAHKQDEIVSQANSYDIKTTTTDSELVSATLTLRTTDLEPLQGRFEFRDREWVEMTELVDQQTTPASTVAGAAGGKPRQPGMPSGPSLSPAAAAPESSSSFSEELQVAAALHQIGADLGEPIEISREGGQIVVSGSGIPSQRQQQIHGQLDRLPHVVVRFADPAFPASATPVPTEPGAHEAAGAEKTNQTARMEQRLGGRPQFERVSGQILDWTDSAMTRAYALRRLAQEFSAATEQTMTAEERRNLHALGRAHLDAFAKDAQAIATTFRPVLTGMGGAAAPSEARPDAATWQAATEDLLTAARRVETLSAVVLGVSAPTGSTYESSPSQLLTALAQLSSRVEQCRKLMAEK